ncbi:penicillin-binding transpeptidase domain-containing protein [Enterococcus raffinosus]|uniref:Penicillin-binding transpeptidase domain-containing protein n=1 Tax=Enterococcus raffinosus TaxID=71452 RepID=A0AAW8T1J3_9ENTE|nr:penicillin-binding transpeptidase domain-containing protein [Enterococcus raffinosus]MDT2523075.1 penicillin-binding transpeptidase domain-containing protein [Enterococcus raffinosus]MDT2528587.1 penicillin-binding transpeptidase domain-containing protein [Enterococcus raffinosus]MDT2533914.1 penicillin-binding transpeptidase domain-containing protein [Enterococcus raffinosus]MDT2543010.1 penicillin-binding transpeptidase domain-containing protein [Enterococcus raffinosus]MDT2553295.1 penic
MKFTNPFKKLFEKLKLADENGRNQNRSHIPFRLNFLFFVIFGLFVILVSRLGYLQIVEGDKMKAEMKASTTITVKENAPRGEIYDAKGTALVKNTPNSAITFTRGNEMKATEILKLATELNKLIDVPADENLTTRDKKDYWLADEDHLKEAEDRLSFKEKNLDTTNEYQKLVDKVKDSEIQLNDEQMKVATIFKRMNAASALSTVFIKNEGVTDEELAVVAERASDLPGVSTGTDWDRSYNNDLDGSLKSILGTITTEKEGLPAEEADALLKKGYARNDRVGKSYLEKQYEEQLQGKKGEYKVTLNQNGTIEKQQEVKAGEKGSNLVLTINSDFQKKVEDILKNHYQGLIDSGVAKYSPGAYAVAMNPNTGEVLAMTGFTHDINSKNIEENTLGTITSAFVPGSVVKAGTVTAGYQTGVISGNDTLIDQPIKLSGTALKGSIYNKTLGYQIPLNTVKALEWSSNAYMMQIVLRMLGVQYQQNMTLPESASSKEMYDKLRKAFAEYGMGVKTQIDLPNEFSGYINERFGKDGGPGGGNLLDLSFGQYDTYTPMQLAQYASTVANGGTRISPHVVKGIYGNNESGGLGKLQQEITGKKLDQVNITADQMGIIKQGFYQAVHGSDAYTTAKDLASAKLDPAAKTGTAETVAENGESTINSNIVAYAPYDNPQIAISVMLPNLDEEHDDTNKAIAKDIINAFADTYGVQ